MDWTGIIKFLGGSTLLLGAIGWVCKSAVSHFLGRDMARLQGEIRAANDRALESFKKTQQEDLLKLQGVQARALADLQAAATKDIVDNHTGIWGDPLVEFLRDFISIRDQRKAEAESLGPSPKP